jgi:hypothetical protein
MALKNLIVTKDRPGQSLSRYPVEPRNLSKTAWFYETPKGIEVVQEIRNRSGYVATATTIIPWRLVTDAAENRRCVLLQRMKKAKP